MAERQQVVRWIRQFLSTVAVAAVTAGVVSGENTGGTGACATDYCEAVPDRLESYSPSEVALRVPTGGLVQAALTGVELVTTGAADDISLTSIDDILLATADDLTALVTDQAIINGGNFSSTVSGIFAAQTTGGGSVSTTTSGVDIQAGSPGDDVSISAVDTVSVASGTNYARVDTDSVDLFAGTAGSDIYIAANDDLQLTAADDVMMTLVASGSYYRIAPVLDFDYVGAAPGSTAETLMASQTVPANSLTATGKGVGFLAYGQLAANTNNKTVSIEFGTAAGTAGTVLGTCNFNAAAGSFWRIDGVIYRTGSGSQQASFRCDDNATIKTIVIGSSAIADTGITYANLTVTNATAAGDLIVGAVRWYWL